MRTGYILAALLLPLSLLASPDTGKDKCREAARLYGSGMYERARSLLLDCKGDPVADGYGVLCAIKMQSEGFEKEIASYEARHGRSSLSDEIDFEYGRVLFDKGRYADASERFDMVDGARLDKSLLPEFEFKQGYSAFARGLYKEAEPHFLAVEELPMSDYRAPSRYAMGYMSYVAKDFDTAARWFELSSTDPRFAELSEFYLVDCRFMRKDYDYVLDRGVAIFDREPGVRRSHLARIISESYLVKGDKKKAREFFSETSRDKMTRSDYFYAGSVLYAVDDFKGAAENFSNMTDRSDSLGQIANYQLANALLQTGNNVGAMNAFRDAAAVSWNPAMQEDAMFNYAKLSFDLNKDTSAFASYIERYNTSKRGAEIYNYMALSALYDRDYAAAVEAYDKIDELDESQHGNYIKAFYLRGEQLVSSGAYRDAIPCLRAAAYYLPKNNRLNQLSRYWQAESCYRTESYGEAAQIFADLYNLSALQETPEGERLSYNAAYSHFKAGEYAQAARWFDIYLNEGDKACRADALLRRGDCDFITRNYYGAIAAYQKAVSEIPVTEDIYPYYRLALAYGLSGDRKSKAAVLANVELADPSTPMYSEGLYELGRAYMDISENDKALEAFTRLRDTSQDRTVRAKALIGIGMVSRNERDYDSALAAYKEVVTLVPGSEFSEDALLAIESIYQARKEPEKYLEYLEKNNLASGKTDSDKESLYFNTAEQIFLGGNYVQAAASLQKYLDSYPSGAHVSEARFYLAESYRSLGNKEKACDFYEMVIADTAESSFGEAARLRLAELSFSLERYARAYEAYSDLFGYARMDENRRTALLGMMRSAYRGRSWSDASAAAAKVEVLPDLLASEIREARYIDAKSKLASSLRDEAMVQFRILSAEPSTAEGAESCCILIQDAYDRADYEGVQRAVYDFSGKAGGQNYWLAKAYIILADAFVQLGHSSRAKDTLESILAGYTPDTPDDIAPTVKSRLEKLSSNNQAL